MKEANNVVHYSCCIAEKVIVRDIASTSREWSLKWDHTFKTVSSSNHNQKGHPKQEE